MQWMIQRKKGFPLPHEFREKYVPLHEKEILECSEDPKSKMNYIGKEVIVLYKYPTPVFGTYEKEFMYRGHFLPAENLCLSYHTHIWIQDIPSGRSIFLSKKRFPSQLEAFLHF
jgi:hypothetical protein